jgi:hypothetical protein
VGGLVGVGLGSYFGFTALSNRNKSNDNCPILDGERRCTQTGADAAKQANLDAWGANIGLVLGGAAVLVGSYLFISGKNEKTEPGAPPNSQPSANTFRPRVSFGVAPTVGGAEGALFGTF